MKIATTLSVICLFVTMFDAPHAMPAEEQTAASPAEKVLDQLIGNWRQTYTIFEAEWTAKETKATGTYSSKRTLGGRFVVEKGKGSDHSTYLTMNTYDTQRKIYRRWYFNSMGVASESIGTWNPDSKTLGWTSCVGNGLIAIGKHHFIDADTIEWSVLVKDGDSKVYFRMQGKSTRVK